MRWTKWSVMTKSRTSFERWMMKRIAITLCLLVYTLYPPSLHIRGRFAHAHIYSHKKRIRHPHHPQQPPRGRIPPQRRPPQYIIEQPKRRPHHQRRKQNHHHRANIVQRLQRHDLRQDAQRWQLAQRAGARGAPPPWERHAYAKDVRCRVVVVVGYLGSICGGWLFLLLAEGVVCLCCEVGLVREGFMRWLDVLLSKV